MPDIREHPDAPDLSRVQDLTVEPVTREEIERRRAEGEVLVEDSLRDREDLDVRMELNDEPGEAFDEDVGVCLYRLCQLFGTPQLPEYEAGSDIAWREDEVFKYLMRATVDADEDIEGLPEEWLFTIHDWQVGLGASVAEWHEEDEAEAFEAGTELALTTLLVVHNVCTEPVQCEYKDIWF